MDYLHQVPLRVVVACAARAASHLVCRDRVPGFDKYYALAMLYDAGVSTLEIARRFGLSRGGVVLGLRRFARRVQGQAEFERLCRMAGREPGEPIWNPPVPVGLAIDLRVLSGSVRALARLARDASKESL